MYKAKAICRKLLFNQRFYFKQLFVLLLVVTSIAAFAGLYAKQGTDLSQFTVLTSLFGKKQETKKPVPTFADSIVQLKATHITATQATLSWAKSAIAEKYTVTVYRKGLKLKSISHVVVGPVFTRK